MTREIRAKSFRVFDDRVELYADAEATDCVMTLPMWLIEKIINGLGLTWNGVLAKIQETKR